MSLERLVDDLARSLARPMPRRTALRLLGGSLVAAATPAVAPGRSLAALTAAPPCNPNVETCCEEDRRVCYRDAPVPKNQGYCCPRPSWKWQCGTKTNGYKCINICPETARQFPCTATTPDRESGYNGLCCDRRFSVGCNADGTCRSCAADEQICSPYKSGQSRCCDAGAGERCFANETSTACCGKNQNPVIRRGKPVRCQCKRGAGTTCGSDCCTSGQRCCGGKECCDQGETCCGGRCCRGGQTCCGGLVCCDSGEWCLHKKTDRAYTLPVCKPTCSPGNRCGKGNCCGSGFTCVNGQCVA